MAVAVQFKLHNLRKAALLGINLINSCLEARLNLLDTVLNNVLLIFGVEL